MSGNGRLVAKAWGGDLALGALDWKGFILFYNSLDLLIDLAFRKKRGFGEKITIIYILKQFDDSNWWTELFEFSK